MNDPALDPLLGDLDPEEREWAQHVYERDESWTDRVTRAHDHTRSWQPLFDAFAARLWPGQLVGWRVEARAFITSVDCLACCDSHEHLVILDLTRLRTDRQVRGALLHEMCHAAAACSIGHDLQFFQQVERLFTLGLRPAVDFTLYPDVMLTGLPRCAALRRRCRFPSHS